MPITRTQQANFQNPIPNPPLRREIRPHVARHAQAAQEQLAAAQVQPRPQALPDVPVRNLANDPPETSQVSRTAAVLNWLANTRLAIWSTSGLLKTVRWCLVSTPAPAVNNEIDASLDDLTGSNDVSKTLHIVSGPLAKLIRDKIISPDLYAGINKFLKEEHITFHKLIDRLLPVIVNNLAKHIHRNVNLTREEPRPIDLCDILSFLSELVSRHAQTIGQSFDAIDHIADPVKKERKLQRLFSPLVEELLSKALPGGIKDLPITIPIYKGKLWKLAKLQLESLFAKAYRIFADPLKANNKAQVLKHKGGESLVSLAKLASEKCAELIPTLFFEEIKGDVPEEASFFPSKISRSAAEGLTGLMLCSEETKKQLAAWLTDEFSCAGLSQQPSMATLWKFSASYIEPLLNHVFASLVGDPPSPEQVNGKVPDAIGIIIIRLFALCSKFFNANGKLINERIDFLKASLKPITKDPELLSYFDAFARELLKLSGLDDPTKYPVPGFLQNILHSAIIKHAPRFLLRQYLVFTDSTFEDDDLNRRLRALLFDPQNIADPAIALQVMGNVHANRDRFADDMFNKFYAVLWEASGTDHIAKIVEALSSVFAHEAVSSFRQHFGISDQIALNAAANPAMAAINSWLHGWAERAFSETMTHILDAAAAKIPVGEGEHPKSKAPIEVLIALAGIVHKSISGVAEHLEATARQYPSDTPEYQKEAEIAFQRLSKGLHSFIGFNPVTTLDLPDVPEQNEVKELLWNSVRDSLLPQILHTFYQETVDWQQQLDESYEQIDDCFHTTHPQWACKVLAQYATDFLKHYLSTSSDEAASLMLQSMKDYMANSKCPKGKVFVDLLKSKEEAAMALLDVNLQEVPASADPHFNALWPALTIYFEALIAKFFAEFASSVHQIESDNPDFMVDTAIQFLKDASEHFSVIAAKIDETGDENVFNVNLKELVAAFGEKLHDGVPINTEGTDQEKDMERMKGCFIPLADKFLKIANMTIDKFPLPSPLKTTLGQLVVDKLIPLCLMKAIQKGMEPQVRDAIMFNFVQTLYAALNAIPTHQRVEDLPEADAHPNPKQKHLYETCGNLVLELVKIIPDTTVQYVFMKERVKEMSAAAIGDAMMPHLSRWTVIQIIDMMIYSGLPSFHPAKWEGKQGRETLVPRRAFVRPDGKLELKPVKDFKFDFPTEDGEITARQTAAGDEIARVRTQLRDAFTRTISQQLHAKAWAFIKSLWALFQSTLDDFVERRFGEKGRSIKGSVDLVFRRVFFDVIGNVVAFLSIPLIAVVKFISEKTVINSRSDDVIRNLESNIMENLIYKWIFSLFDSLVRLKEVKEVKA